MRRTRGQHAIADVAGGIVILLGRLLWLPMRLAWRPVASKRWDRHLAEEMGNRPLDKVKVYDAEGQLLGFGVREQIDRSHTGFAVPFAWWRRAAVVKDQWDKEIRGARFYYGKSGWLLEPLRPRGR